MYLFTCFWLEGSWFEHQHSRAAVHKERGRGDIRGKNVVTGVVCLSVPTGYFPFLLLTLDNKLLALLQWKNTQLPPPAFCHIYPKVS